MPETTGNSVAVLYGLSVLDPVNQIGFAVMQDATARPDHYGGARPELEAVAEDARSNPLVVVDLEQRAELYERISGSRDGTFSPLAVAEFAWRDAALALARTETGAQRQVAKAMYARSAESFRDYLEGVEDEAAEVVRSLLATFEAATRVLSASGVAEAFGVEPLPPQWVTDDDESFARARSLAAVCEELEPEPFGRLSAYEVQVLKRLSVRRRRAVQLFADGELDPDRDASPLTDWAASLEEFQLVSTSRALRGQRTVDREARAAHVSEVDVGFLSAKVVDFISACAAGGT